MLKNNLVLPNIDLHNTRANFQWAETLAAMHRALSSPCFGTVPGSTRGRNPEERSGSHRAQGMLIMTGPGIKSGTIGLAYILDLAPADPAGQADPVPLMV